MLGISLRNCPWLLCALFLSACQPLAWWRDRPLHPNARVQVFSKDGKPMFEKEWRAGKKHGEWTAWDENGTKIFAGHFAGGRKHGRFQAWTSEGRLLEDSEWKNGLAVSKTENVSPSGPL